MGGESIFVLMLVAGLAGGLGHCSGMCGPLVILLSPRQAGVAPHPATAPRAPSLLHPHRRRLRFLYLDDGAGDRPFPGPALGHGGGRRGLAAERALHHGSAPFETRAARPLGRRTASVTLPDGRGRPAPSFSAYSGACCRVACSTPPTPPPPEPARRRLNPSSAPSRERPS